MATSAFPFLDFLNTQPELGYLNALESSGLSPAMKRYFQGQQSDIFNRFSLESGRRAQSGAPPLQFTDYLAQNPFTERYAQLPWGTRNPNAGAFNPSTRWMV